MGKTEGGGGIQPPRPSEGVTVARPVSIPIIHLRARLDTVIFLDYLWPKAPRWWQ